MTAKANRSPTLVEFVIANGTAVVLPLALFLAREPSLLLKGTAGAGTLVLVMYRPMLACRGPRSRAAILFLFICAFLVILGALLAWSDPVGGSPAGSWSARFDAGFRLAIAGIIPAAFTAFPLLLLANFLLFWPETATSKDASG